ncbi:hypothetical protein FRB90_006945 [Tulasnella sp. 427]|nr:hypothetical protein FRB90_006945 [Tulasnella sp. 427]
MCTDVSCTMPFYVYWNSTVAIGSSGQALCTVGRAQYDWTVKLSRGKQSISYNVTHIGDIITQKTKDVSDYEWWEALQLMYLAFSARSWLLGSVSLTFRASGITGSYDKAVTAAAFCIPSPTLDHGTNIVWGDVLEGIEQLSHNISAG